MTIGNALAVPSVAVSSAPAQDGMIVSNVDASTGAASPNADASIAGASNSAFHGDWLPQMQLLPGLLFRVQLSIPGAFISSIQGNLITSNAAGASAIISSGTASSAASLTTDLYVNFHKERGLRVTNLNRITTLTSHTTITNTTTVYSQSGVGRHHSAPN